MSIDIKVYNQNAEAAGSIKLSDKIFGLKANESLVHQAMVAQMANERQTLAHTKDRSEVRGGGKKPWRQKGTGRARAGSNRSPIWIGGGVTFGPRKERNFKKAINQKMKQKALCMAMSDRFKNKTVIILDDFKIKEFKTKKFNETLSGLEKLIKRKSDKDKKIGIIKRSVLVIVDKKDEKIKYSARNLTGAKLINLENINILDLLKFRDLIITRNGIKKLEEKYKSLKSNS
ncbi:MAG: 50S ribosomal protein L4 [Patescibacteria group bacterium]|nr:50S ribosomal protein L4 [Patescibacteria group bacterium]